MHSLQPVPPQLTRIGLIVMISLISLLLLLFEKAFYTIILSTELLLVKMKHLNFYQLLSFYQNRFKYFDLT